MKTTGNDHRVRVTKMLIRRAFTGLLSIKPIQSISIKELCEQAGINRGTFYTHYQDIYDLLADVENEMKQDFQKALEPLLYTEENSSLLGICTGIFRCLKENYDMCVVMLGDYSDKQFVSSLLDIGRQRCMEVYSGFFPKASKKEIEYYYAFVSAGCIGLLHRWLADGMEQTPEELASTAEKIMMSGIAYLETAE